MIKAFQTFLVPFRSSNTPLYPSIVLRARERAPIPFSSHVFSLGLTFESLKELGVHHPSTPKVLRANKRASTPCCSVVFILDSQLNLSKSLGACHFLLPIYSTFVLPWFFLLEHLVFCDFSSCSNIDVYYIHI